MIHLIAHPSYISRILDLCHISHLYFFRFSSLVCHLIGILKSCRGGTNFYFESTNDLSILTYKEVCFYGLY